jgi:two-component system phosphate regulon response regulator OmpR
MARICKILVVEDNDGIRDLLHHLFDDEGYEIAVVGGGEQMRAALAERSFDVAVIDVTLPGGDNGFALAELAREAGCGVILVTGDTRHFESVEQSGHRYLLKPFRIERLLSLVRELVDHADCTVVRRNSP